MKNWLPPVSLPRQRHADRAAQERPIVELVANRVAGPALAVAARIAVLHHEVRHDAVDLQAVEEALARQRHEVVRRQRRIEHRQLELDRALRRLDERRAARRRARSASGSSYGAIGAPGAGRIACRSSAAGSSFVSSSAARTRTAQSWSASAALQRLGRLGRAVRRERRRAPPRARRRPASGCARLIGLAQRRAPPAGFSSPSSVAPRRADAEVRRP